MKKGAQVYIEGKLQTRKWQGQDGQDRYTTEIVVDQNGTLQLLGGRRDGGEGQSPQPQPRESGNPRKSKNQGDTSTPAPQPASDDDYPF